MGDMAGEAGSQPEFGTSDTGQNYYMSRAAGSYVSNAVSSRPLPAPPQQGEGALRGVAPAENFKAGEADGLTGWGRFGGGGVAAVGGRQFLGGFWKNLHLFFVMVHVLLAHDICDERGGSA